MRKQLALPAIIEACARRGIGAICPWRDQVQAAGLAAVAKQIKDAGIGVSGYCRGGFFPAADAAGLEAALEDNRKAVDEAKTLGAACLVLVVGALPGALAGKPAYKDIGLARTQVFDGIAATLEYAQAGRHAARHRAAASHAGGRPRLHQHAGARARHLRCARSRAAPARSASRSTSITRGGTPSSRARSRAPGAKRLLAYHVCDWLVPTRDLLNDRGMMGDGIVELKKVRGWVEAAGYAGPVEVEIFSDPGGAAPPTRCSTPASPATARSCSVQRASRRRVRLRHSDRHVRPAAVPAARQHSHHRLPRLGRPVRRTPRGRGDLSRNA